MVCGSHWTPEITIMSRVPRDDRGKRSDSLRPLIEDMYRRNVANRYAVINPQIDRFKADHPEYTQYVDRIAEQAKHTSQAPFHAPEDVYFDLCHALDKAKR
jgi:hypothetical protein